MSPFVSNTWKAFSVTSLSLCQSVRNGKRRNNCMSPIGWDPPSPPIEQKCRFSLNSDLAYLLSENCKISLVENSTLAQFRLWSRKVKGGWIKKGGEGGSGLNRMEAAREVLRREVAPARSRLPASTCPHLLLAIDICQQLPLPKLFNHLPHPY